MGRKLTLFVCRAVIDSYGLTQHAADDEMDDGENKWRVDKRLLHQASKKSEPVEEAVDLPAKKDIVKRAKYVIHKTVSKLNSDGTNGKASISVKVVEEESKSNKESHGYIVIDQGNRCNILLAEMIRGLLKGSTKVAAQVRLMVSLSNT